MCKVYQMGTSEVRFGMLSTTAIERSKSEPPCTVHSGVAWYGTEQNSSLPILRLNTTFFRSLELGEYSEPRYNEDLGTMEITLLHVYQVSHYIRGKKLGNTKSWDQQTYLVITGFCYIRPLYNEVPLYY